MLKHLFRRADCAPSAHVKEAIADLDLPPPREAAPGRVVPRDLGMLGQATSDSGFLVLEAIAAVQGPRVAADAAAGYADAFARFVILHPDAFD